MKWRDISIFRKIMIGFGVVMLCSVIGSAYDYYQVRILGQTALNVFRDDDERKSLFRAETAHMRWVNAVATYLAHDSDTTPLIELGDLECSFGKWLYTARSNSLHLRIPGMLPLLQTMERRHYVLHHSVQEIIRLMHNQRRDEARQIFERVTLVELGGIQELLESAIELFNTNARRYEDNFRATLSHTEQSMLVCALVLLLVGIAFAVIISRSICEPLGRLLDYARDAAYGMPHMSDLDQKDEVGVLADQLDIMVKELARTADERLQACTAQSAGLRHLLETSPFIVMVATPSSILYSNTTAVEIVNLRQGDDISKLFVSASDRDRILQSNEVSGEINNHYIPIYDKNKRILYGLFTSRLIFFDGQEALIFWINDVTSLCEAERLIDRERIFVRTVLDNIPDIIFVKDIHGTYIDGNKALEAVLGRDLADIRGKKDAELFAHAPGLLASAVEGDELALRASGPISINERLCLDGAEIFFETIKTTYCDSEGNIFGLLGISRDVTTRKQAELALIHAREEAESANEAKRNFLANMSHEIRTPMNGVLGLVHLALQAEPAPRLRSYLTKIETSARDLLGIINSILDFSKIEAGKIELENAPFNLDQCLRSVFDMFRLDNTKHLELSYHIEPDVPEVLVGDALRLGQICINLLGNAVKFTEHGRITLRIALGPSEATHVTLHITVSDTGIGIPADKRDRLFQAFAQADSSTTRRYGGTGLGLSIVRGIVQLMHGDISVASTAGQGTTFTLNIRFGRASSTDVPAPAPRIADSPDISRRLVGTRILLAEDNDINQLIAQEILESYGCDVSIAANGVEAVHRAEHEHFDAILMDIQMPLMDGLEATRTLLANPNWTPVPIIAMTAHAMESDRLRSLDAGMTEHVSKPIEPAMLFAVLCRVLSR